MEDTTYALYREDTKAIGINGKSLPYPALTRSSTLQQYRRNMVYLLKNTGDLTLSLKHMGQR